MVLRGDGWVRLGGRQHRTPAESLYLVPPGETHSNDTFAEGCDYRSILISEAALEGLCGALGRAMDRARLLREPVEVRVAHGAVRRAREFLWDRSDENVSLQALARECGLSAFELARQFKVAYGLPPHAWRMQARAGL